MQLSHESFGTHGLPAVVLLHGLLGSRDNWHSFAKSISSSFHIIVPDLVNHGDSPHVDHFDFPSMADDVCRLLDALSIESAAFVGHSMGGKVAMEVALAHPRRVRALVVEEMIPGATSPQYLRYVEALLALDLDVIGSRRDAEQLLARSVEDRTLRLFLLKNLARNDDGSYRLKSNLTAIANHYDRLWQALESGRSYRGSVLFVRGGKSDTVPDERIAEVRTYFPDAQIETVAEAGHWVHAMFPDEFSSIVIPTLGS